MNVNKKQRYKVVPTIGSGEKPKNLVITYKDDYGHLMRIVVKDGQYVVEHKREGERVFKFYSSSETLEVACSDIETIVDDIKGLK